MTTTGRILPGKREFEFATAAVRTTGYLPFLKYGICALCLSMAALGLIVQFHPMGPHGLTARVIHGAVLSTAVVVGVWWLVRPWPRYRGAIAFVVWADVCIIVCAALTSTPQARLCATIHLGLIGVFAAFLLGWRILGMHCVLASSAIVGFTAWAVVSGQASLFDLFIYIAPAVSSVVVLPVVMQAVIEAGRHSIGRVTVQATRDPLTGLLNRRGMDAAVRAAASTASGDEVVVAAVAVIDVDRFKSLNDEHGHDVGDAALQDIARRLVAMIRPVDIAARIGGDEFLVIAYFEHRSGVDSFVDRCTANLLHRKGNENVSTSVGIACQPTVDGHVDVDELVRRADSAMYRAKRRGGNAVVVSAPD